MAGKTIKITADQIRRAVKSYGATKRPKRGLVCPGCNYILRDEVGYGEETQCGLCGTVFYAETFVDLP